ncbi:MlaC/ttg2D family ABC transporter substrate-binding protein [Woodsholea maritima]|uniref:MlaC/ttg2D family ABC transporter substrate-binding protein n=1 Tax=Woodsholea maritima TaxID=240237 RepID=UPI00036C976C|nr:ABC transporter substrate-binding protein [Woodsholea maritima]
MNRLSLSPVIIGLSALILIVSSFNTAQASSPQDAENFVQTNAQAVISTLRDYRSGGTDLSAVKREFRQKIDVLADVDRVTNFVLGRYRRSADPAALEEFRGVFREFAINAYERELANYGGQTLEVTGSVQRGEGDYIVNSRIYGGPEGREYDVKWRVLEHNGQYKVVDAEVLGIWLAQSQRDQVTSIIGDHGGDVSAATRQLRNRMQG